MTLPDIQVGNFKALFFQLCQGVQHRMVLKGGGDDVLLALFSTVPGSRKNRLVVRLAAAGGEDDLSRLAAQAVRHSFPGGVQGFLGLLPRGVQAGGIGKNFRKIGHHSIYRRPAHPGGGGIIGVYLHGWPP